MEQSFLQDNVTIHVHVFLTESLKDGIPGMASRGWHLDADRLLSCPDNSTACEMGMQRSLCTISCSCNKNNLKCTDSCSACEATCEIRVETLRNVRNDDESNYEITDCTIGVYNITLNLFAFISFRRDCCSNLLQQRCH